MFDLNQIVLWRSYKIEGKWYEGTITGIDRRGTKRQKNPEYHITTSKQGFYGIVIRTKDDMKLK